MKRALLVVLIVSLFSLPNIASAQLKPGQIMITGNLGAVLVKTEIPDYVPTNTTGWGLDVYVEKVLSNPHLTIGFGIGYLKGDLSITQADEGTLSASYGSTPISLGMKYYFGSAPVMGYFGLALASQLTNVEATLEVSDPNSDLYQEWHETSIGVSVPLGILVHVSDNTYVNLGYTPYWTDSEIADPIKHMFMAGLAFTFGG